VPLPSCRKHSGAHASVFAAFERAAYTITKGEINKIRLYPGRNPSRILRPTETHFYVGAFDRAAELRPTRHVARGLKQIARLVILYFGLYARKA